MCAYGRRWAIFRLRRSVKCAPCYQLQPRQSAACRGVLTSTGKAIPPRGTALRAVTALLQAKCLPPPKGTYSNGASPSPRSCRRNTAHLLKVRLAAEPSPRCDMQKEPRPFIDDTTNGRGFLQPYLGPRGWMSTIRASTGLRQGIAGH